jgi:hypothetical protein
MKEAIVQLARGRKCPRCDFDKTIGAALCRKCRSQLPANMRVGLESIEQFDPNFVQRAMRGAANYFHLHYQSIRNFIGPRRK